MSDLALALDVMEAILGLNIGIAQAQNEEAFRLLQSLHPLDLLAFPSDSEYNGWVVPRDWVVHKAAIRCGGEVLFDGRCHPLAVAGYSSSFQGRLTREELAPHIFTRPDQPDAYPFHCIYNYRPWVQHWGFCVPHRQYASWPDGVYEVELDTERRPGTMTVAQIHHEGDLPDTVVFNAHTCHPCQANDDLSGVMAILLLFRKLRGRKTRLSYRAVLGPEHLGTVFYLRDLPESDLQRLKAGVFVEMVGSSGPLVLQQSFHGDSFVDQIAEHVLREVQPDLQVGAFRTIVGNDETVWEAPGVEIPFISISRWPYPQYHTSADNMAIISGDRLQEAVDVLWAMVEILEADRTIERRFRGLVALSNPAYNLYIERPDPVVAKHLTERDLRLGSLQDRLPRYFDGRHTVFQIAHKFGVPFAGDHGLRRYLERFAEKGLVRLHPISTLDVYSRSTEGVL
ncbi:MAG: DUF4910 domain-containing protein [Chthonomonadales bacterium]